MSHPSAADLERSAQGTLNEIRSRSRPLAPTERMAIPPQEMPSQDPIVRRRNFQEVALGYAEAQAQLEAMRCLQCKKAPCIEGCPVRIDIPAFIAHISAGRYRESVDVIKRSSVLPAVCGRVCPQEVQCQAKCTVGRALKNPVHSVSIGRLERFVADREREGGSAKVPEVKAETGHEVAVIGSGPAGITVAADLRREGHAVTVFEAFHKPGGVMVYGIPEFRLPKKVVQAEIALLRTMGVEIRTHFVVGRTQKLLDLMRTEGAEAAFIGTGAGLPKFMNIEGENLVGVLSANEYLTRVNLMRAYDAGRADTPVFRGRRVAVLGGGNVAMDAARTAVRLGAEEVHLVYRRSEAEMPARIEEVVHAKEEGVVFHILRNAKRMVGDGGGRVAGMECLRYELGEPDPSGRRRPVAIPGSEFMMDVDMVIVAIGNECNPIIAQTTPDLEANRWGNIVVDDTGQTSVRGVYAGGDIVLGSATVILAMGQGRRAATAIHERLRRG